MTNIITANLSRTRFFRCAPVYQYNYGMRLVITGIDLPTAYQVDYANDMTGNSITQVGDSTGCPIPAQFFVPGQAIYCWLRLHPTEDSGITAATIVIPISPRATITDEEPTPVEQSEIDQVIAALNEAVEHVDDAVEHYPVIQNGVWCVWDVDNGAYVSTGVQAQGPQGETGATGASGQDGYSPTASVSKSGSTATITITDKNGTTSAQVSDGTDGAPGRDGTDGTNGTDGTDGVTFTPSVSNTGVISWTNDGNRQNPQSVDIPALVLAALPTWSGGSY